MPGLPMRPVARWQLMMALTLSVPCADWFTPCEIAGDDALGGAEQLEEARDVACVEAGRGARSRRCRARSPARARAPRRSRTCGRRYSSGRARRPRRDAPAGREQRRVHAGRDRQKQIGIVGGRGAARIDHHDLGAALAAGCAACAGTAPGWHQAALEPTSTMQIGLVEIGVSARHGVGAEGAAVAGDRRRHAQARIGVDIGRADEALHQLVGDVIVLGQQLAGEIERDRVGSVALDDALEAVGDAVERVSQSTLRVACRRLPQHADAAGGR